VAVSEALALIDRGERAPDELKAAIIERYAIIKDILPSDD
jgi:hypothetical protein